MRIFTFIHTSVPMQEHECRELITEYVMGILQIYMIEIFYPVSPHYCDPEMHRIPDRNSELGPDTISLEYDRVWTYDVSDLIHIMSSLDISYWLPKESRDHIERSFKPILTHTSSHSDVSCMLSLVEYVLVKLLFDLCQLHTITCRVYLGQTVAQFTSAICYCSQSMFWSNCCRSTSVIYYRLQSVSQSNCCSIHISHIVSFVDCI